jgi:hypothetical protein
LWGRKKRGAVAVYFLVAKIRHFAFFLKIPSKFGELLGTFGKIFKINGGCKHFLPYSLNFSQIWLSDSQPFLFWLHIVKKA